MKRPFIRWPSGEYRDAGLKGNATAAYDFLAHLAKKAATKPVDKGTYSYFCDPRKSGNAQLEYTFYVVAIPGAVVVISIASNPNELRPGMLKDIENAVPDLVGEFE